MSRHESRPAHGRDTRSALFDDILKTGAIRIVPVEVAEGSRAGRAFRRQARADHAAYDPDDEPCIVEERTSYLKVVDRRVLVAPWAWERLLRDLDEYRRGRHHGGEPRGYQCWVTTCWLPGAGKIAPGWHHEFFGREELETLRFLGRSTWPRCNDEAPEDDAPPDVPPSEVQSLPPLAEVRAAPRREEPARTCIGTRPGETIERPEAAKILTE